MINHKTQDIIFYASFLFLFLFSIIDAMSTGYFSGISHHIFLSRDTRFASLLIMVFLFSLIIASKKIQWLSAVAILAFIIFIAYVSTMFCFDAMAIVRGIDFADVSDSLFHSIKIRFITYIICYIFLFSALSFIRTPVKIIMVIISVNLTTAAFSAYHHRPDYMKFDTSPRINKNLDLQRESEKQL